MNFDITLWKQVINVNLVAAALLTKAVLPSMIANRSGKILNISSIGGRRGGKGRSAYRATKAGLISLTESVAAEIKPYGIDAVCICPAGVDTEGYREAFGSQGRKEKGVSMARRRMLCPNLPILRRPNSRQPFDVEKFRV